MYVYIYINIYRWNTQHFVCLSRFTQHRRGRGTNKSQQQHQDDDLALCLPARRLWQSLLIWQIAAASSLGLFQTAFMPLWTAVTEGRGEELSSLTGQIFISCCHALKNVILKLIFLFFFLSFSLFYFSFIICDVFQGFFLPMTNKHFYLTELLKGLGSQTKPNTVQLKCIFSI